MNRVTAKVELGAAPAEVWDFVTEPDNFPLYVAGYASGRVVGERRSGAGAEYEWTAALGPLKLASREHVVAWREREEVRYAGTLAHTRFESAMRLEGLDDGGTRLDVDVDFRPPFGTSLLDPLLRRELRRSLKRLEDRFPRTGPSTRRIVETYRARAKGYDWETQLYRCVGFPLKRYRRMAADALALRAGDTVVEIGCGTGANLPYLVERVGPTGRVIGVDLTDAMLEQARRRIEREGWQNVELVQGDAARYEFPERVDGILSVLALTLIPGYDAVIARGAEALAANGRWVVLDLKKPENWPGWAFRLGLWLTRPYCVEERTTVRHPWESIERHLPHARVRDLFLGAAYLAVGLKA